MTDDQLYLIDTEAGTARPVFDFSTIAWRSTRGSASTSTRRSPGDRRGPTAWRSSDQARRHSSRKLVACSTLRQRISWPMPGFSGTAMSPAFETVTGGSTRSSAK